MGPPGPVSENPASSSDADTNFSVQLFTHASPECDLRTPDGWGRRFERCCARSSVVGNWTNTRTCTEGHAAARSGCGFDEVMEGTIGIRGTGEAGL